jgi:hypothetical protein
LPAINSLVKLKNLRQTADHRNPAGNALVARYFLAKIEEKRHINLDRLINGGPTHQKQATDGP